MQIIFVTVDNEICPKNIPPHHVATRFFIWDVSDLQVLPHEILTYLIFWAWQIYEGHTFVCLWDHI